MAWLPTIEHYHKEETQNAEEATRNDQWENNSIPEEEDFEVDCDEEQSGPDDDTGESESGGNESDAGEEYVEDIETGGNESDAEE